VAKSKTPAVFFNASVILAGLKSPLGGSGQILQMSKKKQIKVVISEMIMDEVLRNTAKVGLTPAQIIFSLKDIFQKYIANLILICVQICAIYVSIAYCLPMLLVCVAYHDTLKSLIL